MAKPAVKKAVSKKAAKPVAPTKAKRREHDPLDMTPTDAGLAALLDVKPTPDFPGMYIGRMNGKQCLRAALAYHRDDKSVWTIMFSPTGGSRVVKKFNVGNFDLLFERAHLPHRIGPIYPVDKGIQVFLKPGAVYADSAYRILTRLQRGQDPMVEDTLDDLLDMTPSKVAPRSKGRVRTMADKVARRNKRKQRLQAMSAADLRAWRDTRNARRKLRRLNAKKERAK
jgi:hypothetical protein